MWWGPCGEMGCAAPWESAFASPCCRPGVMLESGETYVRYSLLFFLDKAECLLGAYPASMASQKKKRILSFTYFNPCYLFACFHDKLCQSFY